MATGKGAERYADLPDGTWLWLHDFGRWLAIWIFHIPFNMHVHGRHRVPRTGPIVVVANHSSLLDGPIVFGVLRRRSSFLIKQEMYKGLLRWILPRIGQLSVRRGMPDRTPLLTAVRILRAGGLVGVFPEGGRGTGDVANAENGAAWLARSSGAKILPIACRGTFRARGSRHLGARVDVLVGEPFTPVSARGKAGLTAATEQVRTSLADLVAELDRLRAGTSAGPERPRTGSGESK
jgi:1-acyl-sn-glycerol-3-phosphate acyltransferase